MPFSWGPRSPRKSETALVCPHCSSTKIDETRHGAGEITYRCRRCFKFFIERAAEPNKATGDTR